jgi:hypothetical protein
MILNHVIGGDGATEVIWNGLKATRFPRLYYLFIGQTGTHHLKDKIE